MAHELSRKVRTLDPRGYRSSCEEPNAVVRERVAIEVCCDEYATSAASGLDLPRRWYWQRHEITAQEVC